MTKCHNHFKIKHLFFTRRSPISGRRRSLKSFKITLITVYEGKLCELCALCGKKLRGKHTLPPQCSIDAKDQLEGSRTAYENNFKKKVDFYKQIILLS
jgi:hypothetical protein